MWEYANKSPGAHTPAEVQPTPRGNNWNARGDWMTAHYWRKYYDLDVAGLHARSVNWFTTQERCWKPKEDCPGYGSITTYDLLTYALSARDFDFFAKGKARLMADYGMVITNNLGFISPFGDIGAISRTYHWPEALEVAAWYYRDGRYRWFLDHVMGHVPAGSSTLAYNHYVTDQVPAQEPKDLLGVQVFPLEDWIYEHGQEVLSTAPASANAFLDADPTPPRERCFDKVSFRSSFDRDKQYLLLGGISHGYHAHPDGNAVICFTDNGHHWLFDAGYFVPDTIEHNTVAIYRDGLFEPVPRLTSVEARADLGPVALVQTRLAHYNGTDWRRNIVWAKERFVLVLDDVEALEPGSFGLQGVWRIIGDVTLTRNRVEARQGLSRFCLVNAGGAKLKLAETTPRSPNRRAVFQLTAAELERGGRAGFCNIFYCPDTDTGWPYDVARVGPGAVLVQRGPERYGYVGTGKVDLPHGPKADAAVLYATAEDVYVAGCRNFEWGLPLLAADRPVHAHLSLTRGEAVVDAIEDCHVALPTGQVGKVLMTRQALGPGRHRLRFLAAGPQETGARRQHMTDHWAALRAASPGAAQAKAPPTRVRGLDTLWSVAHEDTEVRRECVALANGRPQPNLAPLGKAKAWTPGSANCRPASATDGQRDTYSAVRSSMAHVTETPKDLGVEWNRAVRISQVWIEHYDKNYRPALDGQDLQYWDGKQWVSIDDRVAGTDTRLWVHTFEPITTTRVRIFITRFDTSRTAIRELSVFAEPVRVEEKQVLVPQTPTDLRVADLDGDGRCEAVIAVGHTVRAYDGNGKALWTHELPKATLRVDAFDLDQDGRAEVVASCRAAKLCCLNAQGQLLWTADCPADQWSPTVEPRPGYFNVIRCADLDGDGDGEIVAGSVNWFAYAFDHRGQVLWQSLNWAHPPLDVTTVDLDGSGKRAALIGTRYCAANLFSATGEKIGSVSVGYHGCATAVAAADLDGNGKPELVAGSRVGSVECIEWQSDKRWSLFMGAEVTRAVAANLLGDESPELVVGSRNAYVLAIDGSGTILWRRHAGDAVLDLAIGDVNGDGRPEVVAGCEDGGLEVYASDGTRLHRAELAAAVVRLGLGDMTGDRAPDIAVATADGRLRVLTPAK